MKLKRFQRIFLFSILIVGAIALVDIISAHSGLFSSSYENYSNGIFSGDWWPIFFEINLIFIILLSFSYYWFGRKDLSESFSLSLSSTILWFFAISDVLYYWLQKQAIPQLLPYLNGHIIIGKVATLLGQTIVTSTTVYLTSAIGLILAYYATKFLVEEM